MDDLRRDVTEAFEKQQSTLGDLVGARERLVRNALAAPETRSDSRVQLAAGIAAVLIAAVVIATFAYVRAGTHRTAPTVPAASPRPLSRPLIVDPSMPVILYHDPANYDQIDGSTWDGQLSGRVDWPLPSSAVANPAATLFATTTQITDRSGRVVATGNFGAKRFTGTWSDDGLHICQMVPFDYLGADGVPATLQLVTPGSEPRSVAQVGQVYEQGSISVSACSVKSDRAVVIQSTAQGFAIQDWVVQLSSGRILWTQDFNGHSSWVTVTASRDGEYVAVSYSGQGPSGSTIFGPDGSALTRPPDGSGVASSPGAPAELTYSIEGFSGDGSLVVTHPGGGATGPVSVVRWSDGSVVWSGPPGGSYSFWATTPEPSGTSHAQYVPGVAIGIRDPSYPQGNSRTPGFPPVDLYVIDSAGHVVLQLKDVYW